MLIAAIEPLPDAALHHPDVAASSPAERQLFRTDFRFAPFLPRRSRQLLPLAARTSSSATASQPAAFAGCPYLQFRHGAPASNKPHPAEKSTPVWLAIWRTWAGFANSQLLRATFQSIYLYTCAHPHCCYLGSAAQTDANLSAHLHRLPTPPPYLHRMRL